MKMRASFHVYIYECMQVKPIHIFAMITNGHAVAQWLRLYATSRKVSGSRPDEVIDFAIYLILPATPGPGVHSVSNRNWYQKHKNNVSGEQRAAGA
jgi:hypothetical protein